MEFSVRSRSLMKPGRPAEYCAICDQRVNPNHFSRQAATFRKVTYIVCPSCHKRYHDAAGQIERYGLRFRFVERSEIKGGIQSSFTQSPLVSIPMIKEIYKILLLAKERQKLQQKEVNWMVDEMTKKILKLPDRVAVIVGKTFAVCGDDSKLSDDEALIRIRDLLEDIDPEIISRNKNKRLSKA